MSNKQTIYTVDALCGAGKTFSAIQYAIDKAAAGEQVVIAQPTRALSLQSYDVCEDLAGSRLSQNQITMINSDTTDDVKSDVMSHLSSPQQYGKILFVTHWTWEYVSGVGWPNKEEWNLIIDEVPSVEAEFSQNVPDNHDVLTRYLGMGDADADGYAPLEPKPDFRLPVARIALNRDQDEVSYVFRDLATWLVSKHWDVFTKADAYNNLLSGNGKKLIAFAVLNPSIIAGFKSVTIMGALFNDTPLYLIWSKLGVTFQPHPFIKASLFTQHTNGALIDFRFMHDLNLSKKLNKQHGVIKQMARAVISDVANDKLLWMANKDQPDTLFQNAHGQQTRLSNAPHGINGLEDIHAVAVVSALNYSTPHAKFLEGLGFNKSALKRAVALQSTYQAMMRSSIRNANDMHPKKVYVFDKQIAEWLQQKFSGSTVTPMPGQKALPVKKPGRPTVSQKTEKERLADQRERTAKCRAKKKAENSR